MMGPVCISHVSALHEPGLCNVQIRLGFRVSGDVCLDSGGVMENQRAC